MIDSPGPDPLAALGALHPDRDARSEDLEAALRDIRSAIEEGQTPSSLFGTADRSVFVPETSGGRLSQGAAASFGPGAFSAAHLRPELFRRAPEAAAARRTLVTVRSAPLADADPLALPWTRAMRPSATRGPFVNDLGERFWIDTFLLPQLVTIVAQFGPSATPRMLAKLPLGRRLTSTGRRRLAAGSVWLSAQTLVPGRPVDEFVSVRIRGGTVQLDGVTSATDSRITLAGAWRLVLVLELDPPPAPQPATGPGADAADASVSLPASVTLTLDASDARMIDVAESSANAYGTSFQLTRTEDPAFYEAASRSVVVPCAASIADFSFTTVRSASWKIGGSAKVARSGWGLPVAVTTPDALGEAAGTGFLWVELATPLHASWAGIGKPATLPQSALGLAPGWIAFWAAAKPGEISQRLRLWNEILPDPLRQSSLAAESVAGSMVLYVSQPGAEAVLWSGRAVGHLDRPVQADGGRVAVRMPAAWVLLVELPAGSTVTVLAADPSASAAPHIAFSLENGLLKVRPPGWLYASGPLEGDQLASGVLLLRFAHRFLLPTLPDPYAANFEFDRTRDFESGWTSAIVTWDAPDAASLAFTVQEFNAPLLSPGGGPQAAGLAVGAAYMPDRVLLDVSSNADQFGVAIPLQTPSLDVRGLALVAEAREVAVVTLPPISWEPMLTRAPAPGDGDVPLPPPPHDGGPARLTVNTPEIRPISPLPLITTYYEAIQRRHHFNARLPLPFGLIAQLNTLRESDAHESPFLATGRKVYWNQPAFATGVVGGLQLAIRGKPNPNADAHPPVAFTDDRLPGHVDLTLENQYAQGVLSTNLFTAFDSGFGPKSPNGIPLRHYELSGYGASLWSDWRDTNAPGPAIIEARFDVMVGRTAHEVIQMQSVLYPWFARVVRTITMDRTPGGWVLREDSGWVAVTNGFFEYQPPVAEAFPAARRHPGAIVGVASVRNIRLDGPQFPIPPSPTGAVPVPTIWQPVRFDADVVFAQGAAPRLAVAGGSASGRVPSRDLTGWIQIDGPKFIDKLPDGTSMERVSPASAAAIHDLLIVKGPATAPVQCGLDLGGDPGDPGLAFRAVRADVTAELDAGVFHLVAAVRGSPALPRDGAWSLARRAKTDAAPNALDPGFPVPVVRPHASLPGANRWHLADPGDITRLDDSADPLTRYGLVQSLGTQKVFFERPRVGNDPDPITLPRPPHLADMGALLNAAGVFPGLGDAFDFQSLKALSVASGDLGFAETFPIGAKGSLKKALLVDLGGGDALQVLIEYHDENDNPTIASIEVNPAASPRWQLSLKRACFAVSFKGKPLISIFAAVKADEHTAPTVEDLRVRYEGILNVLQAIFSNIEQVARFLPGGSAAGLHVGFSHGRLTVHNAFALPNLPLGAGQITDVAVEMGFDVGLSPLDVRFIAGLGSSDKPFRWVVSPLAGTGVVQVAISTKGLDILVQGGLGLGLAIDLGIASGSASITIALELNTGPDPFELRAILSGRASVDVLQGLASATITLAAGLGIIPPPQLFAPPFLPPQLLPPPSKIPSLTVGLTASVSAGIHISICWVIDIDWDGYWQFRQDITTPEIPIPV